MGRHTSQSSASETLAEREIRDHTPLLAAALEALLDGLAGRLGSGLPAPWCVKCEREAQHYRNVGVCDCPCHPARRALENYKQQLGESL